MPKWQVEVTVEGFGPNHMLWRKLAERANTLTDSTLRWELAQPVDRHGETARIHATVEAETPEAAIRRMMKRVRDIGHHVDRED